MKTPLVQVPAIDHTILRHTPPTTLRAWHRHAHHKKEYAPGGDSQDSVIDLAAVGRVGGVQDRVNYQHRSKGG